jgi:Tfp pilus assembly protein FimT
MVTNQNPRHAEGFSLVELLAVMAIIIFMMALIAPAVAGFSSTAGRRGAVNTLMNTFEQARVAALESGQTVYVGFADQDFPVADMQYAAFVVFRDATDEERAADPTRPYVVLRKWTKLPKNVSFKRINNSLVPSDPGGATFAGLNQSLPGGQQDEQFPVIAFNNSGAIDTAGNPLQLFLYEGYFLNGQDNFVRQNEFHTAPAGLFEKITFARYTGRAQLDVTTTATQ